MSHRKNFGKIFSDLAASSVDLLMGGGWVEVSRYKKDLEARFLVERKLSSLKRKCRKNQVIGSFANEDLPSALDTKGKGQLSLPALTEVAIDCLSSQMGFFLMVENEEVDQALHLRNIPAALHAAYELHLAVERAIQVLRRQGILDKTLILVTADHDTGGLAVNGPVPIQGIWDKKMNVYSTSGSGSYRGPEYKVARLSTDRDAWPVGVDRMNLKTSHTAADVDLYGLGPGSNRVQGVIENTEIFYLIKSVLEL